MSPVYSRSIPPRILDVRQDGEDETSKNNESSTSQEASSSRSSGPEIKIPSPVPDDFPSSSAFKDSPSATETPETPATTLTIPEQSTETDSSPASSVESTINSSETEALPASSTDADPNTATESDTGVDSPSTSSPLASSSSSPSPTPAATSSDVPTTTSFSTSTPVVTVTVDNSSSASSASTSESSLESASSSIPVHTSRSVIIKVEGASSTASPSHLETTLSVTAVGSTANVFNTQTSNAIAPSSSGTEAGDGGGSFSAAAEDGNNGFWQNKSAVGGTFAVVGISVVVLIFMIARIMHRRRRARAEMLDEKFISFPNVPPATHYRDESFSTPYTRQPSPIEADANAMNAYNPDVYYETAAYYDAESSDHSHTHESNFNAYPALAQAPTNVYLPPSAPSPSSGGRPSTAQSQSQSRHNPSPDPFADPAASNPAITVDRSPFADPVPQAATHHLHHLRPQAPAASHAAGRISSLYTASDVDSFYGDAGRRPV